MPITRIALLVFAALAAPCALAAIDNYTIDLRTETGGRDVVASATPGPVASVQVTNRTSSRVRCFVDFEGGRLTPVRREAWLDGNTVATIQQRVNDPDITSLDVALSCDSLSADETIPPVNALGTPIVRGLADRGTGLPGTGTGTADTPGTGTTPTPAPLPSGTTPRTTTSNSPRTDVGGKARTTRQTGTTTVISPNPGTTPGTTPGTSPAPGTGTPNR